MRVYFEYFGDSIEIPQGETVIGRDVGCVLRFNDPAVSRRHLRFVRKQDTVTVEDLGSSNGTHLNGMAITGPTQVANADRVTLGSRELTIHMGELADLHEPATLALELPPDAHLPAGELDRLNRLAGAHRTTTIPPQMGKAHTQKINRRRHDRQTIELSLVYVSSELEIEVTTRDLSESGVFVCSEVLDPVGTSCQLTILVDGGPPVRVDGVVRRVVEHHEAPDPVGLGVEFTRIGDRELRWLQAVVAREPASSQNTDRMQHGKP